MRLFHVFIMTNRPDGYVGVTNNIGMLAWHQNPNWDDRYETFQPVTKKERRGWP
jgi:hypothetical protein